MNLSIKTRLLGLIIGLAILPLVLVSGYLVQSIYQRELDHQTEVQQASNAQASIQVTSFVENANAELRQIIQTPNFLGAAQSRQQQVLLQTLFSSAFFDQLILLDATGAEQVHVSRLGIVTPGQTMLSNPNELLASLANNKTSYGPIHLAATNQEPLLRLAVPTLDPASGKPNGMLVGEVRLQQILVHVLAIRFASDQGIVSIVDADGTTISHANTSALPYEAHIDLNIEDGLTQTQHGIEIIRTKLPISLGNLTLYAVADLPLSSARQPAIKAIMPIGVIVGITMLIALALGALAVTSINRPIQRLVNVTRAIAAGDLTQHIPISRRDEIGMLADSFNGMTDTLRTTLEGLEQRIIERTQDLEQALGDREHSLVELQAALQARDSLNETIRQLSSPVLPVSDDILIMPLIGSIDSERAELLTTTLLQAIEQHKARVVVIDVTGLPIMDTQVARTLIDASTAAYLLGARVILVGIRPELAQTLVSLNVDMAQLSTYADLGSGIAAANKR